MNDAVGCFVEDLRAASDGPDRLATLLRHLSGMGIDNFVYANGSRRFRTPHVDFTYPGEWMGRYVSEGYKDTDPVVMEASHSVLPFHWQPLLRRPGISPAGLRVFAEASEFGIRDGMTVPIHGGDGMALLCMAIKDPALFTDAGMAHRHTIHLMALYYHDMVERCAAEHERASVTLTGREREVLLWTSKGKTSWETSLILKVSERTVNFHIEKAKKKLGVTSRSHATVKAIMLGLITP